MQFEKVEGDYFEDGLEDVADVVHDLIEEENFDVCEMIFFEKVEESLKHLESDEMQFENLEVHYTDEGLEGVDDENDFEFLNNFVEEDVDDENDFVEKDVGDVEEDGLKYVDEEHDFVEGDIGDVVEEGFEDVDQENNFELLGDFVEEGVG